MVDEGTISGGVGCYTGLGQDGRKGNAECKYVMVGYQLVGERELIEDVTFFGLNYE